MQKVREQLFFELRPIASGDHRYSDDQEKIMQQSRHFRVKRRLASGERSVQIKYNELFHYASMMNFCDPLI
jgi:hypothetical protein